MEYFVLNSIDEFEGMVFDRLKETFQIVDQIKALGLNAYVLSSGQRGYQYAIIEKDGKKYIVNMYKEKCSLESWELNEVVRNFFSYETITYILRNNLNTEVPQQIGLGKFTLKKLEKWFEYVDERMIILFNEIERRQESLKVFEDSLPDSIEKKYNTHGILKSGSITKNGLCFSFEVQELKYYTKTSLVASSITIGDFLALSDNQYKK